MVGRYGRKVWSKGYPAVRGSAGPTAPETPPSPVGRQKRPVSGGRFCQGLGSVAQMARQNP